MQKRLRDAAAAPTLAGPRPDKTWPSHRAPTSLKRLGERDRPGHRPLRGRLGAGPAVDFRSRQQTHGLTKRHAFSSREALDLPKFIEGRLQALTVTSTHLPRTSARPSVEARSSLISLSVGGRDAPREGNAKSLPTKTVSMSKARPPSRTGVSPSNSSFCIGSKRKGPNAHPRVLPSASDSVTPILTTYGDLRRFPMISQATHFGIAPLAAQSEPVAAPFFVRPKRPFLRHPDLSSGGAARSRGRRCATHN